MIIVCVAGISAPIEPITAASATTEFAGFLDGATLAAHTTERDWGRQDKWRLRGVCKY